MKPILIVLFAANTFAARRNGGSGGPWNKRSISGYVKARGGVWTGGGRLTNTLTGARIASVDFLERVADDPSASTLGSERVIVYKAYDGTRPAKPLRYSHNVSVQLADDGNLLLRAREHDRIVASGWGVGRGPTRNRWRQRAYELSVRPVAKDAATDSPAPKDEDPPGWPRVAGGSNLGTTREEYKLRGCRLSYKRTGRCPTWYGAGVCTLEVEARAERTPWWRRPVDIIQHNRWRPKEVDTEEEWEKRVEAVCSCEEEKK